MRPLLEIAADAIASALAAQTGGADRIELGATLGESGTTPSYGVIARVRERLRTPVFVLTRPRGGDFIHDDAEVAVMRAGIAHCRELGCDGVVLGALTAPGDVDVDVCRALIAECGGMQITLHRAFDAARHMASALEAIIALGGQRLLTSGGMRSALEGAERIADCVQQAAGRIRILAGAGVRADHLAEVVQRSGADEPHASARTPHGSALKHRNEALVGLDVDRIQTCSNEVAALHRVLESFA